MVIGIGVGLTLLGNWVPWPGLSVVIGCFSCARDVGLMFWFCCLPRAVGFCLVVLLVVPVCGCWVLLFSFVWLFVLVEPVCG